MNVNTMISPEHLDAIAKGECFVEDRGRPILGFGLQALFLFTDGYTAERRSAIADCVEEFLIIAQPHLHWQIGSIGEKRIQKNLDTDKPIDIRQIFSELTEKHPCSFTYGSSDDFEGVSIYGLSFIQVPSWEAKFHLSSLTISLPLLSLNADYIGRFHRFASLLRVSQAYAGVGLIQSLANTGKYESLIYEVAQRFPAAEVFSPAMTTESLSLLHGMRSINWLTAAGNNFVEQLGGVEKIISGLSPQILVYSYEGGVMFQAGPKPELGNGEKGEVPRYYREVARALKGVRVEDFKYQFQQGTNGRPYFDREATKRWLARFD